MGPPVTLYEKFREIFINLDNLNLKMREFSSQRVFKSFNFSQEFEKLKPDEKKSMKELIDELLKFDNRFNRYIVQHDAYYSNFLKNLNSKALESLGYNH